MQITDDPAVLEQRADALDADAARAIACMAHDAEALANAEALRERARELRERAMKLRHDRRHGVRFARQ